MYGKFRKILVKLKSFVIASGAWQSPIMFPCDCHARSSLATTWLFKKMAFKKYFKKTFDNIIKVPIFAVLK